MLSGLGIRVNAEGPMLFNLFFRLATKFARCLEEMFARLDLVVLIQWEVRQELAEIL